jgi:membrane-associated phospholipid phosphatase
VEGTAVIEVLRYLWRPDLIIAIQRVFGPGWRPVFEVFALLGGHQLAVIAVGWARWFHGRELACRLLMAVLISLVVDLLIWDLVPTGRPDDPRIRVATDIPISSFPSGHMVTCLTVWGTLAAARLLSPYAVAAIAVLVGFGRLGLGEHYPRDILGGVVIGLVILAFVAWVWPRLRALAAGMSRPQRMMVGVAGAALALLSCFVVPSGRWEVPGLLIGVALGLPVEESAVDFVPTTLPWRARLLKAAIGAAGLGVYLAAAAVLKDFAFLHNLLLTTALVLWALLGAPMVFKRLGWAEQGEAGQLDTSSGVSAPRAEALG